MSLDIKRIYEKATPDDGYRVLVDRMWPRGLSKEDAKLDVWIREIAPSDELRKWYHRDRTRWDEFRRRYFAELERHRDQLRSLAERARRDRVTLLYSSRDTECNNAVVLKEYLQMLVSDSD